MFPPWKLTFQNTSTRNIILIAVGILIAVVLIFLSEPSCGIQHMSILNKISLYEKSLDPEFCEEILEKIDSFNDSCEPEIEILDCG